MAIASMVLFCCSLCCVPVLLWLTGKMPVWFVAVIASPVTIVFASFIATCKQNNWTLALGPEGLWINLCSHQSQGVNTVNTVFYLEYKDVISAARHVRSATSAGIFRRADLALDLRLSTSGASRLKTVISKEKTRSSSRRLPWRRNARRESPRYVPLAMPEDDVLRMPWKSRYDAARPGLSRLLEALSCHVDVPEGQFSKAWQWKDLTDDQVDAQVVNCVESGDRVAAIKLLTTRRHYSVIEAGQLVDQLTKPSISQRSQGRYMRRVQA